jgi:endoglucanase
MKKRLLLLLITLFALGWQGYAQTGPVSCYGKLQVNGNKIYGAKIGAPVQIKGVSLGWSNSSWESANWFNANTVNAMVDGWKAELIRVPLGVDANCTSFCSGYPVQPTQNLNRVRLAINAAIDKDVYVIIDWHSHNAHMTTINNYSERAKAIEFFRTMAQAYGHHPHVIFAIYNEPGSTAWSEIKSYADEVIAEIRQHSTNLVIVGTRRWCTCLAEVRNNKIADTNTAYALHFYADSHKLTGGSTCSSSISFRQQVLNALNGDLAVFVTEWGTTHSDGGSSPNNLNTHNATSSDEWQAFLDQHQISSAAWNVNHKNEGSAFFNNNFSKNVPANFTNRSNMRVSGQYIYDMLQTWATEAVWRTNCTTSASAASAENTAFSIYPNPAKDGSFNVTLPNNETATLTIASLQGQTVYSTVINNGFVSIHTNLGAGIYIVFVQSESGLKTQKLVIK